MSARAERRAFVALAAIFALLVQIISPAMATAAPMGPGDAYCAPGASKTAPVDTAPLGDLPSGQCGHCGHCTAAPGVIALAQPFAEPVALVRYAQRVDPPRATAERRPPARAPPRPPGQGPPTSNA